MKGFRCQHGKYPVIKISNNNNSLLGSCAAYHTRPVGKLCILSLSSLKTVKVGGHVSNLSQVQRQLCFKANSYSGIVKKGKNFHTLNSISRWLQLVYLYW